MFAKIESIDTVDDKVRARVHFYYDEADPEYSDFIVQYTPTEFNLLTKLFIALHIVKGYAIQTPFQVTSFDIGVGMTKPMVIKNIIEKLAAIKKARQRQADYQSWIESEVS